MAIRQLVKDLKIGSEDLVITQGVAGGEIMLAELCVDWGIRVVLAQPLPGSVFTDAYVSSSGASWTTRFARLSDAPGVQKILLDATRNHRTGPFDRIASVSRDTLSFAASLHPSRIHLVCLQPGSDRERAEDFGPMIEAARQRGAKIQQIKITSFKTAAA
jgi:hypothetical protein